MSHLIVKKKTPVTTYCWRPQSLSESVLVRGIQNSLFMSIENKH